MSVSLGLVLPAGTAFSIGRDIPEVARAAEQIGYDSLWAGERVLVPQAPVDGFFGVPGAPWPDFYRGNADPLVVLTLAAAATRRVQLGTSVLIAGLHQPFGLARQLASLDSASGGRVIAGLGTGWSRDEYAAAGVTAFEQRGAALDETLSVCAAVWGPDPVSYTGTLATIAPAQAGPKPARPIPVLLAGATTPAFRRIARRADGWMPAAASPELLARHWRQIQDLAAECGRQRPVRISLGARASVTAGPAGPDRRPFHGNLEQVTGDAIGFTQAVPATDLLISLSGALTSVAEVTDTAGQLHTALQAAGI